MMKEMEADQREDVRIDLDLEKESINIVSTVEAETEIVIENIGRGADHQEEGGVAVKTLNTGNAKARRIKRKRKSRWTPLRSKKKL